MTTGFQLTAKTLVDQHYAAGPDRMKEVVAEALAEASQAARPAALSHEQLQREVAELEQTSLRGSE